MAPWNIFRCPRDIAWGRGSIARLEEFSSQRILIVTDKGMTKVGSSFKVQEHLRKKNQEIKIFDEVEPEPSIQTVMKMIKEFRSLRPTLIVGLGGGSAIDASKAFRVFLEHPDLTFEDVRYLNAPPKAPIPPFTRTIHVTIASTSGTGSDASYASVITDPSIPAKCLIASPELIPTMAVVDPDFADTMPPEVLADSGMDALTHAIESYVSSKATDFSRGLSLQAITLIMRYLPPSFQGGDPVAREHMHYAATLAGMAFSNSSNGICHSVAGIMGAAYHLTHGRANAIALPYVIRYNSPVVGELYANVARAMGFAGENQAEAVAYLTEKVNQIKRPLKVQNNYKETGIPEDRFQSQLQAFVQRAYALPATVWNPRKSSIEDLERLFVACYEGNDRRLGTGPR
jgi:alcohol dehydrogenase class IV